MHLLILLYLNLGDCILLYMIHCLKTLVSNSKDYNWALSVAALGITNGYTIASYSHNELFVVLCFGAGLEGTGLTWLLV